jgi:hypothetical protein
MKRRRYITSVGAHSSRSAPTHVAQSIWVGNQEHPTRMLTDVPALKIGILQCGRTEIQARTFCQRRCAFAEADHTPTPLHHTPLNLLSLTLLIPTHYSIPRSSSQPSHPPHPLYIMRTPTPTRIR